MQTQPLIEVSVESALTLHHRNSTLLPHECQRQNSLALSLCPNSVLPKNLPVRLKTRGRCSVSTFANGTRHSPNIYCIGQH